LTTQRFALKEFQWEDFHNVDVSTTLLSSIAEAFEGPQLDEKLSTSSLGAPELTQRTDFFALLDQLCNRDLVSSSSLILLRTRSRGLELSYYSPDLSMDSCEENIAQEPSKQGIHLEKTATKILGGSTVRASQISGSTAQLPQRTLLLMSCRPMTNLFWI
jgi:hypothetical protein